jgi:hypothetical protein
VVQAVAASRIAASRVRLMYLRMRWAIFNSVTYFASLSRVSLFDHVLHPP